jgi:DNA-binding MarR family transcriptional regulator
MRERRRLEGAGVLNMCSPEQARILQAIGNELLSIREIATRLCVDMHSINLDALEDKGLIERLAASADQPPRWWVTRKGFFAAAAAAAADNEPAA